MAELSGRYGGEGGLAVSRILIDLTDLELWNGHHGGTQRVVYGIAKNFYLQPAGSKPEVLFVAFSAHDKSFHYTSFEPIYERVEATKKAAEPAGSPGPSISLKSRLKQFVRPYVPEQVRTSPAARKAAVRSLKLATRAVQSARTARSKYQKQAVVTASPPVKFEPTDVVLMLGKPWDDLDIQRTLTAEKNKHNFKLVQVVYDLIICLQPQLHHPSLFTSYTQHMFEAVSASDLLLPISQSSANDLKEFSQRLNLKQPTTKVIRLGDEIIDETSQLAAKPDARIQDQFIACVGTIEIRKNHMLLYYAYKLGLEQKLELPQLVIVGGRGWLSGDFQYLVEHDPAMKDKILILDTISDSGLSWIYRQCLFTVYPSMYEGWGLPVAESLAAGKLCLASSSSSIPEIAGDLIDYFSPYDPGQCLAMIVEYLNPVELSQKELQIKHTYKPVSWEDTYQQISKAITHVSKAS
jgi:glycosyltransferase involved in cell wall biosynthesis